MRVLTLRHFFSGCENFLAIITDKVSFVRMTFIVMSNEIFSGDKGFQAYLAPEDANVTNKWRQVIWDTVLVELMR